MRGAKITGGFVLTFIINIILNFEFFIPSIILIILHFVIQIPLFWFWIALGAGLLISLIWTILLFTAVNTGEPQTYQNNKTKVILKDKNENIFESEENKN